MINEIDFNDVLTTSNSADLSMSHWSGPGLLSQEIPSSNMLVVAHRDAHRNIDQEFEIKSLTRI